MSIYDYESAFGTEDKTSSAMRKAIEEWFSLYYGQTDGDPSQRIAYTVVSKLVKTVFGEYLVAADTDFAKMVASAIAPYRFQALQLMLVGAAMMPIDAFAHATYFTLRSGGQAFITFLFDSVFMWVIVVPICFILSRFTAIPIMQMFIIAQGAEVLKCFFGAFLYKGKTWAKSIVND